MEHSRLRWQCRRGMRELDDLLLRYLEQHYDASPGSDKQAFQRLLELPDPQLVAYLLKKEQPASELQHVVARILERNQA